MIHFDSRQKIHDGLSTLMIRPTSNQVVVHSSIQPTCGMIINWFFQNALKGQIVKDDDNKKTGKLRIYIWAPFGLRSETSKSHR